MAVITGAGHGLGREYALLFAREGARGVVVNDLRGADETVALVEAAGGQAVAVTGDCADWAVGERLVAAALERFGRLDALVNNAGILRDRMLFNMSEDEWDDVLRTNLRGHFCPTRHACAHWRHEAKQGHRPVARIVTTTSPAGLWGNAGQANYAASKAGVVGFTLALAAELRPYGVTANVVAPGAETNPDVPFARASPDLRRAMRPDQVAPLVAYLASAASASISGQVFLAIGGRVDRIDGFRHVAGAYRPHWTVASLAAVFDARVAGPNPESARALFPRIERSIGSHG